VPPRPDPSRFADSTSAVVIATCLRANTAQLPAKLLVERALIGGVARESLIVDVLPGAADRFLIPGQRYAVHLREPHPPEGPEFRAAFAWREPSDAGTRYFMRLGEGPGAVPESVVVRMHRQAWSWPSLPDDDRRALVHDWFASGGTSRAWALGVLERNRDVWSEALRDELLELTRSGEWLIRKSWAECLAPHPDSATRAAFFEYSRGPLEDATIGAVLASRDDSPEARARLIAVAEAALEPAAGMTREFFSLRHPAADQHAVRVHLLGTIVQALRPERPRERATLLRIARWARPTHWLRIAALRPVAADTARVVRELLLDTARGEHGLLQADDAPTFRDLASHWTDAEVSAALRDTSQLARWQAAGEFVNRVDHASADTVLAWMRRDATPDGQPIPLGLAAHWIEALGASRAPSVWPELVEWMAFEDDRIRRAVMKAVASYGDRRALTWFRDLSRTPCDRMGWSEKSALAHGVMSLGAVADTAWFAPWAMRCPELGTTSAEVIGRLAGIPAMLRWIDRVDPEARSPEQAATYERLEARIRRASAPESREDP
jgi:hypothetical protein